MTRTPKPRKKKDKSVVKEEFIDIFITTDPNITVRIHEWKLEPKEKKAEPDFSRIGVQTTDLCYSLILDPLEPKVETWEVDDKGQLSKNPIAVCGLPFIEQ